MKPDQQLIKDLEQARIQAMLAKNVDTLDKLLLPEAVWVHASGHEDDKSTFLDGFREGRLVAHALTLSDQTVHAYGDVGVVHGTVEMDATMDGQRRSVTNRYTTIWVGDDAEFRIALYQATTTPK